MARSRDGAAIRRAAPAALLLLFAAMAALSLGAGAETGAPALEIDGVWRSHGDWTVQEGEQILHANESIEAFGNVTIESNATLRLLNVTLVFPPGAPAPRTLAVGQSAYLFMTDATLRMKGAGDRFEVVGGTASAEVCVLSFEGQAGHPSSFSVQHGWLAVTDSTVVTDATVALDARSAEVSATDSQFVNETGAPSDVFVAGPGFYTFDTTQFGTLRVENDPAVLFYSTVRFFLFSEGGVPLEGSVSGVGAYGEFFNTYTRPENPNSLRLKWLDLPDADSNLTAAERRSPGEVRFTAVAEGVGGNTTSVFLDAPRVNVTVVLDRPFDLGVASLTIIGGTLETQGLKRAYYVGINDTQDVHIRIRNNGYAASPPTTLLLLRKALNGSTWNPVGEKPLDSLALPSLGAGESVNFSIHVVPGTYGGFVDASAGCTASVSYVSALAVRIVQPNVTDFRPANDAAEFDMVAYDVKPRYGPGCEQPTADILPVLGVMAITAIVAVVVFSWWFSETQAARRAARREEAKRPPP